MAKKTVSQLRTEARNRELMRLMEFVRNDGEDASQYDGNAFSYPIVYEDGTESWVQVKISIPTGTRDGKQFDGYEEHENFVMEQEEKRIAAEERATEKAKQTAEKKAKQEAARKKREAEEAQKKAKRTVIPFTPEAVFVSELKENERFICGQQTGKIISKNNETKFAIVKLDDCKEESMLRYSAEVYREGGTVAE